MTPHKRIKRHDPLYDSMAKKFKLSGIISPSTRLVEKDNSYDSRIISSKYTLKMIKTPPPKYNNDIDIPPPPPPPPPPPDEQIGCDWEPLGTLDAPYHIKTAEDLQNIENDLTAHYVLCNDIDLSNTEDWGSNLLDPLPSGAIAIHNVTELQAMKDDLTAYYYLANDIDASATAGWNDGAGFEPVGTFYGTFDGRNHKIDGLFVGAYNGAGLFGSVDNAAIQNVWLTNANISAANMAGGICSDINGDAEPAIIRNCHFSGTLSYPLVGGKSLNVGGITGFAYNTIIENCTTKGSINARSNVSNSYIGGIVGKAGNGAVIQSAHCSMTIHTEHETPRAGLGGNGLDGVGGIIAQGGAGWPTGVTVQQCSFTGSLVGGYWVGGIIGEAFNCAVSDCASAGNVVGGVYVGGVLGKSASSTSLLHTYSAGNVVGNADVGGLVGIEWNSNVEASGSYWDVETTGQATSAGSDPSFGKTTVEMQTQGTFVDWDFDTIWQILTNDYPSFRNPVYDFTPIGNNSFTGSLDGQEYSIKNLIITRSREYSSETYNIGLFRDIGNEGIIKNLHIVNGLITGSESIGSFAGYSAGTIINCTSNITVRGDSYVGGIAGSNYGLIKNCKFTGNVEHFYE